MRGQRREGDDTETSSCTSRLSQRARFTAVERGLARLHSS